MMRKLSLFAVLATVAMPAVADTNWGTRAGSSADLSSAPATRTRERVNYEKYFYHKDAVIPVSDHDKLVVEVMCRF